MCCGKKPKKKKTSGTFRIRKFGGSTKLTIQSVPTVKKLLLCRPNFYAINYSINPWMKIANKANQQRAVEQWDNLRDRLTEHGADIVYVAPKESLPDMVFTANAGLVLPNNLVILSNFKHDERKPEERWFLEWFLHGNYTVKYPATAFEGAGDALFLGEHLICGHGFRSELTAYEEMKPWLGNIPILLVGLVDPRFYHLDTCFCPLGGMDYLIYPEAFDKKDLAALRALGGNEIEVPEEEALRFACNAVSLGKKVVLPTGCRRTVDKLTQAGYTAISVEMEQFLKAGGACKCLTLAL